MSATYQPPLKELDFILNTVVKAPERTKELPNAISAEEGRIFLEGIASYVKNVAFPLNEIGDRFPATHDKETFEVKMPPGFKEAYDKSLELGIPGLLGNPELDGWGLTHYLVNAANEMLNANFPLAATSGLSAGAAQAIASQLHKIEDEETRRIVEIVLRKIHSGEWSCAMVLTQSHAGTDLALIKNGSVAENGATGDFVSGDKFMLDSHNCFITSGMHDLTENICYLVLGRLPDAPEGIEGISLILVSQHEINPDGTLGAKNGVKCEDIEHKMGIKGSPTCAMSFDASKGWLIGDPHKGMEPMFVMMNDERLNVCQQGLGASEMAFQNAVLRADMRVQGKKASDKVREKFGAAAKPSTEIIEHGNIRKDIVDMKANIDTWRALSAETAVQLDLSKGHPDEKVRAEALNFVEVMTPVLKGCVTDYATAATQKNIQIHGGDGFITATGVEQFYRDALIATIYEGTNDVQSMDFVTRKARGLKPVVAKMGGEIMQQLATRPELREEGAAFQVAQKIFEETSGILAAKGSIKSIDDAPNIDDVMIYARDYMEMFGKLAQGAMALKIIEAATPLAAAEREDESFYKNKVACAHHFIQSVMVPEMKKIGTRIKNEAETVNRVNVRGFANDLR